MQMRIRMRFTQVLDVDILNNLSNAMSCCGIVDALSASLACNEIKY